MTTETLTADEITALEQFRCDRRWSYRQLAADVSEVCRVSMPESSLTRAMTVPMARLRKTTIHPLRKYLRSLKQRAKQLEATS
jgi:hypothetical protein